MSQQQMVSSPVHPKCIASLTFYFFFSELIHILLIPLPETLELARHSIFCFQYLQTNDKIVLYNSAYLLNNAIAFLNQNCLNAFKTKFCLSISFMIRQVLGSSFSTKVIIAYILSVSTCLISTN